MRPASQNARKVIFVGTFTAGGLEVAVDDHELRIVTEGRNRKFIADVEQITFNGTYGASRGQDVFYITERCVFRLVEGGLQLTEVAPGIDVQKDILDLMEFAPIMDGAPKLMDARIFGEEPMELRKQLLEIPLSDRLSHARDNNIVFANLSGVEIEDQADLDELSTGLNAFFNSLGGKVNLVSNYDGITIAPRMAERFANLMVQLETDHYLTATRYTTSAFLRQKLGQELKSRSIPPHIFESREEAAAYVMRKSS